MPEINHGKQESTGRVEWVETSVVRPAVMYGSQMVDGVPSLKYSPQSKSSFVLPTTSYISHLLTWIQSRPLKFGKMLQMYIFLAEFPSLNLPSCSFAVSESNALMWNGQTYINMP